jgi:hypothetical protein
MKRRFELAAHENGVGVRESMAICIDTIEPGVQYVMIVKNTWVGWHVPVNIIVTP